MRLVSTLRHAHAWESSFYFYPSEDPVVLALTLLALNLVCCVCSRSKESNIDVKLDDSESEDLVEEVGAVLGVEVIDRLKLGYGPRLCCH